MSRRFVSLWLPYWPTDRLTLAARRSPAERAARKSVPLALAAAGQGGMRVVAVNRLAEAENVRPGMTLADACAICVSLAVKPADPLADRARLEALADWCGRYSPWVAVDGTDGVKMDITGSAHLFGGEAALLDDLLGRLERIGVAARAAAAPTPAAAWAWARHGAPDAPVLEGATTTERLGALPLAALRLPAEQVETLARLGLCAIGDLYDLPRAPLAARFGAATLRRLDQALGRLDEPTSPPRPAPAFQVRLAWSEPIGTLADVSAATARLLERLCRLLAAEHKGARRLALYCYRIDGTRAGIEVGTARATRAPDHLMRLFADRLETIDAGFGIETMILAATSVETALPRQLRLQADGAGASPALEQLVDRLENRFGPAHVVRPAPVESHIPECAVTFVPALSPAEREIWGGDRPRPIRLLPCPEPIEAMAEIPDGPPVWFRWRKCRHRVARAEGPERIAPEWWRSDTTAARVRDYYRVEDHEGRRFWLYRDGLYDDKASGGHRPRWYLHGLFP